MDIYVAKKTLELLLSLFQGSTLKKIRPPAKIDNFILKNNGIIIEEIIWRKRECLPRQQFESQTNNIINQFYFCLIFLLSLQCQIQKKDVILINYR